MGRGRFSKCVDGKLMVKKSSKSPDGDKVKYFTFTTAEEYEVIRK